MRVSSTPALSRATDKGIRTSRISIAFLTVLWLVLILIQPFQVIDDAYISYRYAYNLVNHGQLVFNLGERVEGMTNMLWTLILALIYAASHAPLPEVAVVLSLGLLLWSAIRLIGVAQALEQSPLLGALAGATLLLSRDVVLAMTNGLEGALYIALLVELVYRFARRQIRWAFSIAGLLFLTRPEGAVVGVVLLIAALLSNVPFRQVLAGGAILVGIVGATILFRLAYYGSPIPNSVIAKSIGFREILTNYAGYYLRAVPAYALGFAAANQLLIALFIASLVILVLCWQREKARGVVLFCLGTISLSWLIMARNGGDWMPHFRLLTQYAPLYIIPLLALPIGRRWPLWCSAAVAFVALVFQVNALREQPPTTFGLRIDSSANMPFWATVVERTRPVLRADDTLSAEALGYIGYALPDHAIHDPLGLTDRYLATHGIFGPTFGREDANYTLGTVKPSVVIWHYYGHVVRAKPEVPESYTTFCASGCDTLNANVVMVRNDRLEDFAPVFADWQRIHLVNNQPQPLQ